MATHYRVIIPNQYGGYTTHRDYINGSTTSLLAAQRDAAAKAGAYVEVSPNGVTGWERYSDTYTVTDEDNGNAVIAQSVTRDEADAAMTSRQYGAFTVTHDRLGTQARYIMRGNRYTLTGGDQPREAFESDAEAFAYATEYRACVYQRDTSREVYCARGDH